ncbi:hypothetical protein CLU79DRAFT_280011 [Phycomyces nitens]|nr:hypothetical protein CLU79DRAFT_280011 [Phycomyces nitens]
MITMRKSRDFSQKNPPNQDSKVVSHETSDRDDNLCKKYFNSVLAIVLNAAKYSTKGSAIELAQSLRDGIMTQAQLAQFISVMPSANGTIQRMGILGVIGSTETPEILQSLADSPIISDTLSQWLTEASNAWYISIIIPIFHILDHIPLNWTTIDNAKLKPAINDVFKKATRIIEVLEMMPGDIKINSEDHKGNFMQPNSNEPEFNCEYVHMYICISMF